MYCKYCGTQISDDAAYCEKCGKSTASPQPFYTQNTYDQPRDPNISDKDWIVVLVLCLFTGCLGLHRFYVGKIGTAIAQLLTGGGCGIWQLIDFINIVTEKFTDEQGKRIVNTRG